LPRFRDIAGLINFKVLGYFRSDIEMKRKVWKEWKRKGKWRGSGDFRI